MPIQTACIPKRLPCRRPVVELCRQTAHVTDAIVRAARERSLPGLRHAVELAPTIVDKRAGLEALHACVQAHADLLPTYN